MHRLLVGDVGSGKTAVALYAALVAVAQGKQAAFLAPMAISIVWGLTFTTLLVLIVIPCAFSILDDLLIYFFGSPYQNREPSDMIAGEEKK